MNTEQKLPNIRLRMATRDDAQAIASVLRGAFAEYEPLYTERALAATTPTSEEVASRISEGPVWIASQGEAIVGIVSALPQSEGLYIRGMAVLSATRGQRLGNLPLDEVEAFAITHGYKRLFLSTTPFLTRAIKLYKQRGFRRESEGPDNLHGTLLFTMAKYLVLQN